MRFLPAGRWPHLHYLTFIKLINCRVARSIIIEMTFPVLCSRVRKDKERGHPGDPAFHVLARGAAHGSTCSWPISTGSSKTVQTTASLQSGVVREPW